MPMDHWEIWNSALSYRCLFVSIYRLTLLLILFSMQRTQSNNDNELHFILTYHS